VTALRKLARDDIASKRSITHAIPCLLQEMMSYKPALHAYSAVVDSFFYPCSVNVQLCPYTTFFDTPQLHIPWLRLIR